MTEIAGHAVQASNVTIAVLALAVVAVSAMFLIISSMFRGLWRFFPGGHRGVWVLLALITAAAIWILTGLCGRTACCAVILSSIMTWGKTPGSGMSPAGDALPGCVR